MEEETTPIIQNWQKEGKYLYIYCYIKCNAQMKFFQQKHQSPNKPCFNRSMQSTVIDVKSIPHFESDRSLINCDRSPPQFSQILPKLVLEAEFLYNTSITRFSISQPLFIHRQNSVNSRKIMSKYFDHCERIFLR